MIRKIVILALLALVCAVPARAQLGNTTTIRFAGAPTGSCAALSFGINNATGALYDCLAGAWSLVGGGGAVISGSGTAPEIAYWSSSSALGSLTGVANGVGTNCDGFGTSCKLKIASPSGDYVILVNPTGAPAGGYAGTGAGITNGVTVSNALDAWDGTNYAFYTLNSVTGSNLSTKVTVPKYIFPQGTVTACSVFPAPFTNAICEQAPAAVTTYSVVKPPVAAQGTVLGRMTAAVITQGFSGDADHSNGSAGTTIGSGTSIGSTSLCSTANCPVGTYRVNVYVDITTPCGTTGTYVVNLIYTDDQGSKTVPMNINGTGAVPATGVLTTTSTANFGEAAQIIRSTGAASINYSTTAVACGTAGPMVGKLYLSVEPVQ